MFLWAVIGKYSGQKPLFLPQPPNFENLISSLFFYFIKICSCHHCHHFHVFVEYILNIGRGRWLFVKNLEREEVNIKHCWCGIGWRGFGENPLISDMSIFLGQSLFLPCFWKNRKVAYSFPPMGSGEGADTLSQNICRCIKNKLVPENFK